MATTLPGGQSFLAASPSVVAAPRPQDRVSWATRRNDMGGAYLSKEEGLGRRVYDALFCVLLFRFSLSILCVCVGYLLTVVLLRLLDE